ncbi:hypothetical protein NB600_00215 [Vibrio antiquarius]|uniref:hypothetical protein n=1 Tax=Vibrio antiquarius (strain Ex25) TaxID=150340 RepID=UPI00265CCC72|nr:hypothetical protein [Vibrio antiquarius]MCR9684252.1 hypothetical protein [Vibrio antiquarius]
MIGNPRLILKDLRSDLADVASSNYQAAAKGAHIAAAIKRFKSNHYLRWLRRLEKAEGIDMTPRLARELCGGLFDRRPSTDELQAFWQNAERSNIKHSQDFSRVDDLIETHKAEAADYRKMIESRAAEALAASR